MATGTNSAPAAEDRTGTAFRILAAVGFCHFLNDLLQSVIPAVYPILKTAYRLDFAQIGMITFAAQITPSLLQPAIGWFTDRRPAPASLPTGMAFTLCGVLLLAWAPSYAAILVAVSAVGVGSAVFHPEASRVARMASGGAHGMAQSLFQVGGNVGASLGPLLAAFLVLPGGQRSIAWCGLAAVAGIFVLSRVGRWYARHMRERLPSAGVRRAPVPARRVWAAMAVLVALMFSKYVYLTSLSSYYTFFLMSRFQVPVRTAQLHLFLFLGAVAAGTLGGGFIGDRIGRKRVIWWSILGALPFSLMLPYASLFWTGVLAAIIGATLASAFPAIVVYAQELVPGNVGAISGLFFGLAFGMAAFGAAALGRLADAAGIEFVYRVCSFLPLLGLLTAFLPALEPKRGPS